MITAILLDLPGPQFLLVYLMAMGAALVGLMIMRSQIDGTSGLKPPPLEARINPFYLAWLRGGDHEMIRLMVFDLIHRDYLTSKKKLLGTSLVLNPAGPDPRHLNDESRAILRYVEKASRPHEVFKSALPLVSRWTARWQLDGLAQRLLPPAEIQRKLNSAAIVLGIALLLLGFAKLQYATAHGHRNIGFLMILMFVAVIALAVIRKAPRLTQLGRAYVAQAETAFLPLRGRASTLVAQRDPTLILAVATFGVGVLSSTAYSFYPAYLQVGEASAGGGSSCGSGSSCGGGGCGGGGCGGCGGS